MNKLVTSFCALFLSTALIAAIAMPDNRSLAAKYRKPLLNRFLKYTTYNSQSNDNLDITPEQIDTAHKLYAEIKSFGFPTTLTEHYYIYVEIPANISQAVPTLGFSCHYDTTPDIIGKNIKAQVIEKYDGKPIVLKNNHVIDFKSDPYLKQMIGKTVVTSDGTTMLSADDKAGVSVMVTLLQTLAKHPEKKHGKIQVVITPNEDVGRSADYIEETPYRPDIAFDFDGGVDGEVVVGNFNAEKVIYHIKGVNGQEAADALTAQQVTYQITGVNGHQSEAFDNGYRNSPKPACELGDACVKEEWLPHNAEGKDSSVELHSMQTNGAVTELKFNIYSSNPQEAEKHVEQWTNYADLQARAIAARYDVTIERKISEKLQEQSAKRFGPHYRNSGKPACALGNACAKEEWLPNKSRGRQGYVELHSVHTKGIDTELDFRLRSFDQQYIEDVKALFEAQARVLAKQYDVIIEREVFKQYQNVDGNIHPQARQIAQSALTRAGVTPHFKEERAGTTASMLMLKLGKGAYTIFTGQNNAHNFTEWLSEDDMFKSYLVALNIIDEVTSVKADPQQAAAAVRDTVPQQTAAAQAVPIHHSPNYIHPAAR